MKVKKQKNIANGARLLFFVFIVLFLIICYRFLSIQMTGEASGQPLAAKAQQIYHKTGVIEAKRGTIYDRNGEVIAEDTNSYTLVAILSEKMKPNYVQDKEKTAKELAKYIDLPENEIYRILSKEGFQVEFGKAGKDIPLETKQAIEKLELPGITFIQEKKRFYPNGIFSSHVIGFVDTNKKGVPEGVLGIEKYFNDLLTGKNGSIEYESDFWGYLLHNSEEKIIPAEDGKDIYLTIDKKIQTFVEEALNQADEMYAPKKMIVIVADPKTGDILAMGQRPTFHPKTREGINQSWHNEAIETVFEPGSTMKIFTVAAALEEQVLNLNETFKSGSFKATDNSPTIRDHNYVGWNEITYLEGIQRSSNVAMAYIVRDKLGYDKFREYLTKFGFEYPTGIELPNEVGGKIVYRYPIDKITTGYGQGTAITPLQQIQALTAIANDGKMIKPQIVNKIVDPNTGDVIKEREVEIVGEPISANTAKKVREVLETVITSPVGTGYNRYNLDGYEVAGKTGTANITENGKYLDGPNDYLFSFLGMAPAKDPELIVYVAVQQPQVDSYSQGSQPVSQIFKQVMKNSLQYLSIEPTMEQMIDIKEVPKLEGLSQTEAITTLEQLGFQPVLLGNGETIVDSLPKAGEMILQGEKIILKTDGELIMPNITGWSLRDVMKIASLGKLELNIIGNGYVVNQNLQAGHSFHEGDYFVVELKTPFDQLMEDTLSEEEREEGDDGEEDIEEVPIGG